MPFKSQIYDTIATDIGKRLLSVVCAVCLLTFAPNTADGAVLTASDARLYRRIFALDQKGEHRSAQELSKKLKNRLLDGYVLYNRYYAPKYRTSQKEIEDWLQKYGHLAVADDIYALGKRKKMDVREPKQTQALFGGRSNSCSYVRRDEPIDLMLRRRLSYLTDKRDQKAKETYQKATRLIRSGNPDEAEKIISNDSFHRTYEKEDVAIAETALAFSYYLNGAYAKAIRHAKEAVRTDETAVPLAYWTAGLAEWRRGNYYASADWFAQTAAHAQVYPLLRAGASFWAARAYLRSGQYKEVGNYLEAAAQQPRTFYGMLAMRMMGEDQSYDWNATDGVSETAATIKTDQTDLFEALKQVGKKDWAVKELGKAYLEAGPEEKTALAAIGIKNDVQIQLTRLVGTFSTDNERFPIPEWQPKSGWKIDEALVYAFVRQESCFKKEAKSAAGAVGLMQLMPETAKRTANMSHTPWKPGQLENAAYNLELGQNYLKYLMKLPAVNYNLIYLAAAYNGGPGNLIKWKKQTNYPDDPLVFIESIPSRETRAFIERIMVNYWIYRSLLGKSRDSMDMVISGKWPLYR